MKLHTLFISVCLLLMGATLHAQGFTRPGQVPEALLSSPKLMLQFDSKRSFISKRDIKIFGVQVGLDFDEKVATGFGFYFLRSPFIRNFELPNDSGGTDMVPSKLKFAYISLWVEYMVLVTKKWELSVPLSVGFGEAEFRGFEAQTYTPVVLLEGSLEAQYKIFPWIGLGAGIGYRGPVAGRKDLRENFGAPVYRFGVRFFLGYVIKKILNTAADW